MLASLFTVGLCLRSLAWPAWRLAVILATGGMLVTIALAGVAAIWLLALPWGGALVLATILAPTDPVLASEVQVRGPGDRDAVRLTLTAEGGLNDGTALPLMLLALAVLGLHPLGPWGLRWALLDVLWAVGGGLALCWLIGRVLDRTLHILLAGGHPLGWDELLCVGTIALGYGLARLTATSAFLVVFASGVALFWSGPHRAPSPANAIEAVVSRSPLDERLVAFGARCERLLEVFMVLALGPTLTGQPPRWDTLAYALLFVAVLRPWAVSIVVRPYSLPSSQRRLVAWLGVRGVGSAFYLALALHHGSPPDMVQPITSACLWTLALSIVLHRASATPLMNWYQSRQARHHHAG